MASYRAAGHSLDAAHVKTSFAFMPGVSASYDLSSSLAVQGSMSYMIDRPKVLTRIDGVSGSENWNLNHGAASLGLVLGVF